MRTTFMLAIMVGVLATASDSTPSVAATASNNVKGLHAFQELSAQSLRLIKVQALYDMNEIFCPSAILQSHIYVPFGFSYVQSACLLLDACRARACHSCYTQSSAAIAACAALLVQLSSSSSAEVRGHVTHACPCIEPQQRIHTVTERVGVLPGSTYLSIVLPGCFI